MRTGCFPSPNQPEPTYSRGEWPTAMLDGDFTPAAPGTRRQLLLGIGCFALGGLAALAWGSFGGTTLARPADWLDDMLSLPEPQLLIRAGDYERRSRQHGEDARIVPAFTRLLEVAAASGAPQADVAAACAVRTLAKLGGLSTVATWQDRLGHLPSARDEARRALAEEEAQTRRNKR
jgi:hypothetical protein